MGIDRHYQGIPSDAEIIKMAYEDKDVAEDMLFPILLCGDPLKYINWLREQRFAPIHDLYKQYPEMKTWHHRSGRRCTENLIDSINQNVQASLINSEYEKTLGYKIVRGYEVFSSNFKSTTGFLIRVSPPIFVKECAEWCKSFDINLFPEGLKDDFNELSAYYQKMASYENVSVFVMEN